MKIHKFLDKTVALYHFVVDMKCNQVIKGRRHYKQTGKFGKNCHQLGWPQPQLAAQPRPSLNFQLGPRLLLYSFYVCVCVCVCVCLS